MDLESVGADFNLITQVSKNATPDPSSNLAAPPIPHVLISCRRNSEALKQGKTPTAKQASSAPMLLSHQPASLVDDGLSCPTSPLLSHPNTPPLSPPQSRPNSPPLSPLQSRPNSPPNNAGEDQPAAMGGSELPLVEILLNEGRQAAAGRKRSNKGGSEVPSKNSRILNIKKTTAPAIEPPAQSGTQRHLKCFNQEPSDASMKEVRTTSKELTTSTVSSQSSKKSLYLC